MKAIKLAGLNPEPLFGYFEKLCSIPHGSRNTKAISDYFVEFAAQHGLGCIQEPSNNVILFRQASAGYEDHPPVILQAHMDMVCQKKADCTADMQKDPLDVTHDGTFIFARGTSLGADDGAGVALCLALLADPALICPPLEVIFTTDEEIGLIGANQLDASVLKGRRMINLDGAYEASFAAGCAGGTRVDLVMPLQTEACRKQVVCICLEGLHGGHSGGLIHLNLANANKAMGQLLAKLRQTVPFKIVSFAGGTAGNAICKSCQAQIEVDGAHWDAIGKICDQFLKELKETYDEPEAALHIEQGTAATVCTEQSTNDILSLVQELPNGMQQWFSEFNIPLTSLNMGIAKTDDAFRLHFGVRSNIDKNRMQLLEKIKAIAEKYNCTYSQSGVYCAWEYRADSPLRNTMTQVYHRRTGKEAVVKVSHAGLECGVIGQKLPGLDCVSCGPNMRYIHTADEKLEIASFARFYEYLKDVLKEL